MGPPGEPDPKITNRLQDAWQAVIEWMIAHRRAAFLLDAVGACLWVSELDGPLSEGRNLIQAGYMIVFLPIIVWVIVESCLLTLGLLEVAFRASPAVFLIAGSLFVLSVGFGERMGCASSPKQRSNSYWDPRDDYDDRDPPWRDGRR